MRVLPILLLVSLGVAGCGSRDKETRTTATSTTTTSDGKTVSGLSIDADGFKANVEIPNLSFSGNNLDMDGMKLYPGSKVRSVRVKATEKGSTKAGLVTVNFTSPAAPATVSEHLAREAEKAGFTLSGVSPAGLKGTKREDGKNDNFAFALVAEGSGTSGELTMTDGATDSW